MSRTNLAKALRVDDPCGESWDEMTGDAKIRFCSHCQKSVSNLSEMTQKQVRRLIRESGSSLCVRYRTDPKTGIPVFADHLSRMVRHGALAGAIGASLIGAQAVYAQGSPRAFNLIQIERVKKTTGGGTAKVSGVVTDPNGAAIPYALVTLTNLETLLAHAQNASGEGSYEFKDLEAGKYKLRFEAGGFAATELAEIDVREDGEVRIDGRLAIADYSETVEVAPAPSEAFQEVIVGAIEVSVVGTPNDLVTAVLNEHLDEVKARVIMGAKINSRDKTREGMSPLHAAVEMGNVEIVEYLLLHGAKANIRNSAKETPLMVLENWEKSLDIMRLLIRHGAKLTLADKQKNTVLHHLAASIDDADMITEAITNGAVVDKTNKEGMTPLMFAAGATRLATVETLLKFGANINIQDRDGMTALDHAEEPKTRLLLENCGAVAGNR